MKKVVIFGAAGHTGKYITRKMISESDIELSVFVRNPEKFGDIDMTGVNIIKGDAVNYEDYGRTGYNALFFGRRYSHHGKKYCYGTQRNICQTNCVDNRNGNSSRNYRCKRNYAKYVRKKAPRIY